MALKCYDNMNVNIAVNLVDIFFAVHDTGSLLLPVELQSASPGSHCSSNPPPPTQTAQSQLETTSPLAEGRWDADHSLAACMNDGGETWLIYFRLQ